VGDHVRALRFTRADVILVAPHDRMGRLMPERGTAVGAGPVRSFTACFLRQYGLRVTVCDREEVAAGWSWGNVGWLTPPHAAFLPEPAVPRYGGYAMPSFASKPSAEQSRHSPGTVEHRPHRIRGLDTMRSSVDRAPPAARSPSSHSSDSMLVAR